MANSYLTRTPSSGGNRKTFTISSWFKRSKLGATQILVQAATDGSTRSQITLRSDEMLQFYSENGGVQKINVRTTRVLRDTSAWYHVVVAVDTTQGTASNRVKIYINGVQETSLNITVYGDQNYDTQFNHTVAHTIGRRDAYVDMYFEGYQSHFALVDGTFFSEREIERDISLIPHPLVKDSLKLFSNLKAKERNKIIFTHFNHTNPLIDESSKEHEEVLSKGFRIAKEDDNFYL